MTLPNSKMPSQPTPNQSEITNIDELINKFIKKWLPDYYAHLVDNDENDGERLRSNLNRLLIQSRLDELIWSTGVEYKYDRDRKIIQDRIAQLKLELGEDKL